MQLKNRGLTLLAGIVCATALWSVSARGAEPGLLVHLPLEHDVADVSGNHVRVAAHNEIEFVDGAAFFSGDETWLELPHVALDKRPFTVTLWIHVTGAHPMYGLVEQMDANRPHHWLHLMLRGSRQPYLGFYINDSISPQPISTKQWTHLAFTYDGESQKIWVDGKPICFRKTSAYQGTSGPTIIGRSPRWNNVPSRDFQGFMRDFRIYDRALGEERIAELSGREIPSIARASATEPPEATGRARMGAIPFLRIEGGNLTITGEQGQIYEVFGTDDLTHPWASLATVTNHWGELTLVDPDYKAAHQRFYRVKFLGAIYHQPPEGNPSAVLDDKPASANPSSN